MHSEAQKNGRFNQRRKQIDLKRNVSKQNKKNRLNANSTSNKQHHQQPTSPQKWSMRPRDAETYLYIPKPNKKKKDNFNQTRKQNDLKRKVSKQDKTKTS